MSDVAQDVSFMRQALHLAEQGRGQTTPNPMVGAVLVKQGRIIGKGYHREVGGPHAEIIALHQAGPQARGSTLYVTLEPCCHTNKRTPPCVPALIQSHINRIVVAMRDPNPRVHGRGIRHLKRKGIAVEVGCLAREAQRLNEFYLHWIRTGRPFVILKAAMTVDGKIATALGKSKWITEKRARQHVHQMRSQVDAIMVGIGTVLKDDPRLSARIWRDPKRNSKVRQPIRVIMDSRLRIPLTAQVLRGTIEQPTIVATTRQAPKTKIQHLKNKGIGVFIFPLANGQVSFAACLRRLGRIGMTSVLLEGGSALNASALKRRMVEKVMLYISPKLLGGQDAKSLIGARSPRSLAAALPIMDMKIRSLGKDYLLIGSLRKRS